MTILYPTNPPLFSTSPNGLAHFLFSSPPPFFCLFFSPSSLLFFIFLALPSSSLLPLLPSSLIFFHPSFLSFFLFIFYFFIFCSYSKKSKTNIIKVKDSYLLYFLFYFILFFSSHFCQHPLHIFFSIKFTHVYIYGIGFFFYGLL